MYSIIKLYIRTALRLYFKKIKLHGLENIPKDKPVLFLPNHQNALLDVLLIAIYCQRKPWFLARSDVFNMKVFLGLFNLLQMIPIYRIRDGRKTIQKNQEIFDRCATLLLQNKALVIFPEANHNLKRRVRPLSNGFNQIIHAVLERTPTAEITLVPIGVNYNNAIHFPDSTALYFGTPIVARALYDPINKKASFERIRSAVSKQLKTLTTHIENEETYDKTVQELHALSVNYLDPKAVNKTLQHMPVGSEVQKKGGRVSEFLLKLSFNILNFPLILVWRFLVKPKVPEPEFLATFRFAFALFAYPIYYGMIVSLLTLCVNIATGLIGAIVLFVFNWCYVRLPWSNRNSIT